MYVFTHVPCSSSQREAHAYTQAALAMIYLTKQTQSSGLCYQLQSPARACAPGRTPRIGAATVQGAIDRCHRRGKKGQRERCSTLSPNITTGLLAVRFIILICRRLVQRSAAGEGCLRTSHTASAQPLLPNKCTSIQLFSSLYRETGLLPTLELKTPLRGPSLCFSARRSRRVPLHREIRLVSERHPAASRTSTTRSVFLVVCASTTQGLPAARSSAGTPLLVVAG